jgi:hypothetical protein
MKGEPDISVAKTAHGKALRRQASRNAITKELKKGEIKK